MVLSAIIAMALPFPTASVEGKWQYRAFNERGQLIASGPVVFRGAIYKAAPLGEKMWGYFGSRQVKEKAPRRYGPHGDRLAGYGLTLGADLERDGTFRSGLSQQWRDHDLLLVGKKDGLKIEGTWSWTVSAQIRASGRFTLTREG